VAAGSQGVYIYKILENGCPQLAYFVTAAGAIIQDFDK